jgi:WD40 repeat protein
VGLVAACAVAAAAAVLSAVRGSDPSAKASVGARDALPAAKARKQPTVVFRSLDPRRASAPGQVAVAALGTAPGRRTITPLSCDRVYFSGGSGICLTRGKGFAAGYRAKIFGPDLEVRHELDVAGVPSRARVSPDGRYGAVTMFVAGHSYADAGKFSTLTTLIDLAHGKKVADLEQFVTTRNGRRVTAIDVNYWGVTFGRDSDRFYATLATGGKTYLIQGSVRERSAHVIHANVECPSLSPDGTRIAYKKRTGSSTTPWRLTVLDLATMRETPLADQRSVDDQVEWLDDDRVLYGLLGDIWLVRADGGGEPSIFIPDALSPAVVRS